MNISDMPVEDLRALWSELWGHEPHPRIGRAMLEKSVLYKQNVELTVEQQNRLNQLIKDYKKNPTCFDERAIILKPGTRLERTFEGTKHVVHALPQGFEYQGETYSSLSKIANHITSKKWNGYIFFGLKGASS